MYSEQSKINNFFLYIFCFILLSNLFFGYGFQILLIFNLPVNEITLLSFLIKTGSSEGVTLILHIVFLFSTIISNLLTSRKVILLMIYKRQILSPASLGMKLSHALHQRIHPLYTQSYLDCMIQSPELRLISLFYGLLIRPFSELTH